LAAALLAAGCAPSANNPGPGGSAAPATSLIAAYNEGGTTLSPYEASDVTSDTFVLAAYDQLVTYAVEIVDGAAYAKTDEIAPMLASSWDVNADATEYTFHLRDDVTFHSGNKFTSADVVGSLRVQQLSRGEVGLALEIPPKDVASLEETDGVTIDSRASNKILFFAMNNKVKPFDNPKVRQAFSYAMPYDALLNDVMRGQASPLRSAVPSSMPGFSDAGFHYSHDLDKAKALLAEAGYPDGFEFDFTLGGGFQDWADNAVLIQAELAKIGVTMNINSMARPQFLEALATKEVQAYISRWTSFVNDPQYHLGLLMITGTSSNYMNYSNAEVDALQKASAQETDPAVRLANYAKMQDLITADAPWAYLYEYNIVVGLRDTTTGYTSYPDGIVRFHQLSVG